MSHTKQPTVVDRDIAAAIERIRTGGIILVRDSESREDEGDFVCAASLVTAEEVAFMAVHGRGLICTPIEEAVAARLDLHPMARENTESHGTAFTVSVDGAHGVGSGISAADRARTIATLVDPESVPADLRRPGHVFPLVGRTGGVRARPGHTEAAIDLAKLAGLPPAGVICEVLREDGEPARGTELEGIATRFGMPLITIEDLIRYLEEEHHERSRRTA
jgi:3,4-dihydroxy 2-butanone 4-phosphate synthase / GTP cyclohydrolase II